MRTLLASLLLFVFACEQPQLDDAGVSLDAGSADVTTTPPDAAPATSSGGSGGLDCESTGTVSGLSYCIVTIAGVELKIIEPEDDEGPLDLAIYLHGDGARAYEGDTALRIQAPFTHARRTLYVAARAPNTCAWWLSPDYSCERASTNEDIDTQGQNADALASVISALQNAWDLNYDPILFGGSSGGAVFLSGAFLPLYGDQFHGAFALGCGGFAPYTDFAWQTSRENQGSSVLYFSYGDADAFRTDIEAGIDAYQALDFRIDVDLREGGIEHCAFDHIGWVTEAWSAFGDQI